MRASAALTGKQHVRIAEQRQDQPRADEPVDRRQALDAQRRKPPLQQSLRPDRGDHEECAQVARDYQRKRREN